MNNCKGSQTPLSTQTQGAPWAFPPDPFSASPATSTLENQGWFSPKIPALSHGLLLHTALPHPAHNES